MKHFVKFTDFYNGNRIYVDLSAVVAISDGFINNSTGSNPSQATTLYYNSTNVTIKEYISEVLALLEGRDTTPAKILFGHNDSN